MKIARPARRKVPALASRIRAALVKNPRAMTLTLGGKAPGAGVVRGVAGAVLFEVMLRKVTRVTLSNISTPTREQLCGRKLLMGHNL